MYITTKERNFRCTWGGRLGRRTIRRHWSIAFHGKNFILLISTVAIIIEKDEIAGLAVQAASSLQTTSRMSPPHLSVSVQRTGAWLSLFCSDLLETVLGRIQRG